MNRTPAVSMIRLCLASLLLSTASTALAQTAPANVVTPAPPPREGTVGPEQLRDFNLPGTRTTPAPTPEPTAPAPRTEPRAPATPGPRTAPATGTPPASRPAPAPATQRAEGASSPRAEPVVAGPAAPTGNTVPAPQVTLSLGEPALASPSAPEATPLPLPEAAPLASPPESSFWWAWLIVAALVGLALAMLLRQRSRRGGLALAGGTDQPEYSEPQPTPRAPAPRPASPAPPAPTPPPEPEPALPSGLVTTRLRSAPPAERTPAPAETSLPAGLVSTRLRSAPSAAAPEPELPVGAVVSTRLRPWVDLDLALSEVVLTEQEAVLRFRLTLANGGMAGARDLVVEALALNAGETQGAELATFYARPDGEQVGVADLQRLGSSELTHDVRMPRAAIREYEMQGRRLFVPILAFNVGYRWSGGKGRTSAAFLVGFEQPGSDRLAPLGMDEGPRRLTGLGVRRLEDQVRR